MRRKLTTLCLTLSALLPAVGFAQDGSGYLHRSLVVQGTPREYLVRVPVGQSIPPRALVLLLHGHRGSAAQIAGVGVRVSPYRPWSPIADRENLLLVAPDGLKGTDGEQGWNDCRVDASTNPGRDDVEFLSRLVAALTRENRIPPRSVFVVGTSNGGFMALRLAIERPALAKAFAAVVAAMPARSECAKPRKAVPVLFMNGTADPLIPYEGGSVVGPLAGRGSVLSAEASVAVWTKLAGVSGRPAVTRFPGGGEGSDGDVARSTYSQGGRPMTVLYRVEGGGHVEPSRIERYPPFYTRIVGPQNATIEMADEVWGFFAAWLP